MFNSIPIPCNQAEVFPRGGPKQAKAWPVLFANVIGPPLFFSPWSLFSPSPFCPPLSLHCSSSFQPSPPVLSLPSAPLRVLVVIVISYFLLIPASAASGHWLQNPLSFVYFNYANEDSSAGLLEAAGEKAATPLRVITIHPLVSL